MTSKIIGRINELWRYPLSSLAGEQLNKVTLQTCGPRGDRTHAVFDNETMRPADPAKQLWRAAPRLHARMAAEGAVQVSLDGANWVHWSDRQLWLELSSFFGRPVHIRPYGSAIDGDEVATRRYQMSPVHLLSTQSMAELSRFIPQSMVDARRFRPNIVVDLPNLPGHAPERALIGKEFTLGGIRLKGSAPCGRCSFTTLEQTGLSEDRAVLKALISHFGKDFGIYCEVLEEGVVSVGDTLMLDSYADAGVIIVGAGQAGGTAALCLRDLEYGGPIRVFGNERYAPYERPPLSKSLHVEGPDTQVPVLSAKVAREQQVKLHLGETVLRIDRELRVVETDQTHRYPYDQLILATGGTARLPDISKGFGRVHVLRNNDDAEAIRRRLKGVRSAIILGGGWLGLEIAASLRKAGLEIDVLVRQGHVCARYLPTEVAIHLENQHRENGVRLHLAVDAIIEEHEDGVDARWDGASVSADIVIVAIGIHANDHLARLSGLPCNDGILTDSNGRTKDPAVFAIGDVSRQVSGASPEGERKESWQNAVAQATRMAHALMELPPPDMPVPQFWSDQFDMKIQIAGQPDPAAVPLRSDVKDGNPYWEFESFAVGINRVRDIHRYVQQATIATPEMTVSQRATAEDDGPLEFHALQGLANLEEDQPRRVTLDGVAPLVLVRKGETIFAMDDKCPHANASLAEGFVEGNRLVCPLHFAEFELATGRAHNAPPNCANARCYQVASLDDAMGVWLPAAND